MARYFKAEDVTPYLTKYIPSVEAVERSKIDKAIEEIEALPQYAAKFKDCTEIHICREDVLEILKRNIGE